MLSISLEIGNTKVKLTEPFRTSRKDTFMEQIYMVVNSNMTATMVITIFEPIYEGLVGI